MSTLPDSPTIHKLLYVPFNQDYHIYKDIAEKLTEDEFFSHCYVNFDFDSEMNRIENTSKEDYIDEAYDGYQYVFSQEIINARKTLESYKSSLNSFEEWIRDNGNGVYCIKGDAGTGKTTFLHHMQYTSRGSNLEWEILDLQEATIPIRVYSQEIRLKEFSTLANKVISTLLGRIFEIYLPQKDSIKDIVSNLDELFLGISARPVVLFQTEETNWFFEDASIFNLPNEKIDRKQVKHFINELCSKIQIMIDTMPERQVIEKLLDIYLTLLQAKRKGIETKYLIAFDNIERFIGVDEIYNPQVIEFVSLLRNICDSYYSRDVDFYSRFQFIILMRNTSSRMSNASLQSIEFGGHDLDLSGWFPVDLIISNKIRWYKQNGFTIENMDIIDTIIGDYSFDGHGIRSLYVKIGSILNRDKRIIVTMLDQAIRETKVANPEILNTLCNFVTNKYGVSHALSKFAGRSIVMRLILDVLQSDNFFRQIRTQEDGGKETRLSISRKSLIILNDFYLSKEGKDQYMPFDRFIEKLMGQNYFDENNNELRNTVSSILYTMNYYNRRTYDWLRFIDIQYNHSGDTKKVENYIELEKLLRLHPKETGIRITEAGMGYLKYIVQSFEYFSCRYNVGERSLLPLLCLIPTKKELLDNKVSEFECFQVVSRISKEAFKCIEYMRTISDKDIKFKRNSSDAGITHTERIVNSHTGYISNFMQFVKEVYRDQALNEIQKNKLVDLEYALENVSNSYRRYARRLK